MQQDAGEVVPGGIQAKQRTIKRVRHPGEWMPVRLLGRGQRPRDGIGGQSLTEVRVVDDIAVIIVVHERVAVDRVVKRER